MGLPLYNPPVESDILPPKPISERRVAIARSRIRAHNANNNTSFGRTRRPDSETTRQRLLNLAQQTQSLRRQISRGHPSAPPFPLPHGLRDGPNNARVRDTPVIDASWYAPRNTITVVNQLLALQNDIFTSDRGDEICMLARVPSDRPDEAPLRGIRFHSNQTSAERMNAVSSFVMQPFVERNPRVLANMASRFAQDASWPSWREAVGSERAAQDFLTGINNMATHLSTFGAHPRPGDALVLFPGDGGSRLDGLGDRNRSLSPEGYDVWETLLTTVTPDPQPPSIGSSFTSASASAVASQSAAPGSSATSFTNPDTAEGAVWHEPGCESESGDTESDEGTLAGIAWNARQLSEFTEAVRLTGEAETRSRESEARHTEAEEETARQPRERREGPDIRSRLEALRSRESEARPAEPAEITGAAVYDLTNIFGPIERARVSEDVEATRRSYANAVREHDEVVRELSDAARDHAEASDALAAARARAEVEDTVPDMVVGMVGGVGGMQNIIRSLARRQDIPNSWWAEAGLSRNIPGYDTSE